MILGRRTFEKVTSENLTPFMMVSCFKSMIQLLRSRISSEDHLRLSKSRNKTETDELEHTMFRKYCRKYDKILVSGRK